MANIPITGVPSSHIAPGQWGELLLNQGPSNAAIPSWDILVTGPMLASGATWTANTLYEVRNEADAISGAGAKSPLHIALYTVLKHNKTARLYALPYAATSGGTPVSATGTVTYATNPTGTGIAWVDLSGHRITIGYNATDTVTTIATRMRDAVNAWTHSPATASNASGVLTLTANVAGASQGDGTTGCIRFRAGISAGTGTTVATSGAALGLGTGTAGADGTTTEAANLTAALATITTRRFGYHVPTMWDATALAALKSHVVAKSEPRPGNRGSVVSGLTGALAGSQTIAIGVNEVRHSIAWQRNSEWTPWQLAANLAAVLQKREQTDKAYNFDGYNEADWSVPAAYDNSDWLDDDDINDAITDGLTAVQSSPTGSYITMAATTRSKNAAGSQDDFRGLERHRLSVGDAFMDDLLARTPRGKKLKDDLRKSDGTIDQSQRLGSKTITPSRFRPTVALVARLYENRELIASAAEVMESLAVSIDPDNDGRLEVGCDIRAISLLHQMTFRVAEVNPG